MSPFSMRTAASCAVVVGLASLGLVSCGGSSAEDAADHAWAVGSRGTIMATTDGGAHWFAQTSGTRFGLSGVSFADTTHGWAVGGLPPLPGDGEMTTLILATTDGGSHWVPQYESAGLPLRAVACSDADHIWAAGSGQTAVILASNDGGRTWTKQHVEGAVDRIVDLAFADDSHGWAVGTAGDLRETDGSGYVLATTDGGSHWKVQATLHGDGSDWGIAFGDAGHGWVVGGAPWGSPGGPGGSFARVWLTSDGGETWNPGPVPEGTIESLMAVACTDARHVWTQGAGSGDIFRTTDGGLHWLGASESIVYPGGVLAIAFIDNFRGWALTRGGRFTRILATTDGGVSWDRQAGMRQPTGNDGLWDIACPPATGGVEK